MQTRPPAFSRILIAVGFTISCFGLALFLWLAFGGAVPLKPEGYRFSVPFEEATQLSVESDVRISGVSVGKVKRIDLNCDDQAEATIEIDNALAPIPSDTRATLRQKTLLGETYVELTPGSQRGGAAARGRRAAVRAGRRVGSARRDLPRLHPGDAGRVPGLDAGPGRRHSAAAATTSRSRSRASTRSRSRPTRSSGCSTPRRARSRSSSTTAAPSSRRSPSARASSAG